MTDKEILDVVYRMTEYPENCTVKDVRSIIEKEWQEEDDKPPLGASAERRFCTSSGSLQESVSTIPILGGAWKADNAGKKPTSVSIDQEGRWICNFD